MLIRLLFAVFAAYLILSAAYVVFFLLVIVGLIFRTKETLGLMALGLIIELFSTHPVIATVLVVVLLVGGALTSTGEKPKASEGEPDAPEQLPLPPPSANPADGPPTFDVILTNYGGRKIKVISQVRAITEIGLTDAKALVESAPSVIMRGVSWTEAHGIARRIQDAGGITDIRLATNLAPTL